MEASREALDEVAGGRLRAADADVGRAREHSRQRRLLTIALLLAVPAGWLWFRILIGRGVDVTALSLPVLDPFMLMVGLFFLVLIGTLVGTTVVAGRSPHVTYRPEQIATRFEDVRGIDAVKAEVVRSLNLFLAHRSFSEEMGGTARRGILFEGPPGTGKTYIAKAMAAEADVPFLFVSATSFQSMYYGATARKIRSYFRALRKTARREGGAIGFMEEIDAIATARGGLEQASAASRTSGCGGLEGLPAAPAAPGPQVNASVISEGTGGVVNELLVQMQSFDEPPRSMKLSNALRRFANKFLPPHRQIKTRKAPFANILLIGATNRADNLDPALLRPGRFDRVFHFGMPARAQRRELIDYFLTRKAHDETLDNQARDDLAASTMGYSPASLERLFDEALLFALRAGRDRLSRDDLRHARLDVEIGLAEPTEYTPEERATIATHESGHAVIAYLVGKGRKLDLLSIVKRKDALGLLAHSEIEERYTKRRSEALALIQIALGGMAAEELMYGESGTGPAGDLAAATAIAVEMVGSMGLGGSLISFRALDDGILGGNLVAKVLADDRARGAVDGLLREQKEQVAALLGAHRHILEALRDALLDRDELVGREIIEVIEAAQAERDLVVDLRVPLG